jgi:hypothetical protein
MKNFKLTVVWICVVAALSFVDIDGILGYDHRTLHESGTVIDPLIQTVVS